MPQAPPRPALPGPRPVGRGVSCIVGLACAAWGARSVPRRPPQRQLRGGRKDLAPWGAEWGRGGCGAAPCRCRGGGRRRQTEAGGLSPARARAGTSPARRQCKALRCKLWAVGRAPQVPGPNRSSFGLTRRAECRKASRPPARSRRSEPVPSSLQSAAGGEHACVSQHPPRRRVIPVCPRCPIL